MLNDSPFFGIKPYDLGYDQTIAANTTATPITVTPKGGGRFAWDRLLINSDGLDDVVAKIDIVGKRTETLVDGVRLSTLRNLFLERQLLAPVVIPKGGSMDITLTNEHASSSRRVQIAPVGYPEAAIDRVLAQLEQRYGTIPEPVFYLIDNQITLSSTEQFDVQSKAEVTYIAGFSMDDEAESAYFDVIIDTERVKQKMSKQMFIDELALPREMPFTFPPNTLLTLEGTEYGGAAADFSFLVEAYGLPGLKK